MSMRHEQLSPSLSFGRKVLKKKNSNESNHCVSFPLKKGVKNKKSLFVCPSVKKKKMLSFPVKVSECALLYGNMAITITLPIPFLNEELFTPSE
jgi:hypothetical protein